jgi:plasmid stability protein
MGDLTLNNVDGTLIELLAARAAATGRPPEEVAKEALLKGLLWSPEERTAYADKIRAMQPGLLDVDTTEMIRRLRNSL